MEFEQVIKERFSVRKFKDQPIEEEKLSKILKAGLIAPTAKNIQPQRIYVLKSEAALEKIRSLTVCAFNAPVVLLVAYDLAEEWNNPLEPGITSGKQDASIAATQMMLAAWNQGIASCWVGYFPNTAVAEAFDLPENIEPMMLLPLGYADDNAKPAPGHLNKRPVEEIIRIL